MNPRAAGPQLFHHKRVVVWLDSNGEQVTPSTALAPDAPGAVAAARAPDPCGSAGRIHAGRRAGRRPDDGDVLRSGDPIGCRTPRWQPGTCRPGSAFPTASRGAVRFCGDCGRRTATVGRGACRGADVACRQCPSCIRCAHRQASDSSTRSARTSRARLIVPDCGSLLPVTGHGSGRDCVGPSGYQSRNTCPWEDAR